MLPKSPKVPSVITGVYSKHAALVIIIKLQNCITGDFLIEMKHYVDRLDTVYNANPH